MRRRDILETTGMDAKRFETLMQREQLPFASKGRWADYSLVEAYELKLFMDLIGEAESETPALLIGDALSLIANSGLYLRNHDFRHPLNAGGPNLWLGVFIVEDGTAEQPLRFTRWFAGPLEDVTTFADDCMAESENDTLVRVLFVNASRAAKEVRQKAHDLELPESLDFSEIWRA